MLSYYRYSIGKQREYNAFHHSPRMYYFLLLVERLLAIAIAFGVRTYSKILHEIKRYSLISSPCEAQRVTEFLTEKHK